MEPREAQRPTLLAARTPQAATPGNGDIAVGARRTGDSAALTVLDGTEIAALLISKRADLLRVSDVILIFNVLLSIVAMSTLGVNEALYSILTYVAATQTLDFVLYGIDQYMAMTIVSDQHDSIRTRILNDLGRGVTLYRGSGGMSGVERVIVYCVVTRLEIAKVKKIVRDLDESAFLVFHPLSGAEGGIVKRRFVH